MTDRHAVESVTGMARNTQPLSELVFAAPNQPQIGHSPDPVRAGIACCRHRAGSQ
jgi:hypothetical protein